MFPILSFFVTLGLTYTYILKVHCTEHLNDKSSKKREKNKLKVTN